VLPALPQASEQHCAPLVHDAPIAPHMPPVSGDPASGQHCEAGLPQLFMQLPEQPLGVQHVSADVHVAPLAQLHDCATPQLSATETLHWLAHRFMGTQHEWLLLHSSPAWHPALHETCCPQLFVTVTPPQRLAHASLLGVQQTFASQTSPLGQMVDGHEVCWPQLLVTVTPHWSPHAVASSGAQQVLFGRQTCPLGQLGVLACPQLTVRLQLLVT